MVVHHDENDFGIWRRKKKDEVRLIMLLVEDLKECLEEYWLDFCFEVLVFVLNLKLVKCQQNNHFKYIFFSFVLLL